MLVTGRLLRPHPPNGIVDIPDRRVEMGRTFPNHPDHRVIFIALNVGLARPPELVGQLDRIARHGDRHFQLAWEHNIRLEARQSVSHTRRLDRKEAVGQHRGVIGLVVVLGMEPGGTGSGRYTRTSSGMRHGPASFDVAPMGLDIEGLPQILGRSHRQPGAERRKLLGCRLL